MSEKHTNVESESELQNHALSASIDHILQAAYVVYSKDKLNLINSLLMNKLISSVLIFAASKANTKTAARELRKLGYESYDIHEDMDPEKREIVLEDFTDKEFQILVVSDILVREISLSDINLIINYDAPNSARDYVARIVQNTASNNSAVVITFINDRGQKKFKLIEDVLGKEIFKIEVPTDLVDASGSIEDNSNKRTVKKKPIKR
ncbi:MAG: DEAD/DEAH box helicase [Chitinophagales bacterium]